MTLSYYFFSDVFQIQKLYKESAKTGRLDTAVCLPAVAIETGSVTRRQDDVHVTNVLMGSGERAVNQVCTMCTVVLRSFICFYVSNKAALFWFVSLSCFSLAISFIINQIKTTCTYERARVQVSKEKSSLIEAKGSLYGTFVIGEHEVNFKVQVNLKNLKSNLHLFFKEIT